MSNPNVYQFEKEERPPTDWKPYVRTGIYLVVLIALLLVAFTSVYIVKEGEYKVVRQFGEVVRIDEEPGLKVKVPFIADGKGR